MEFKKIIISRTDSIGDVVLTLPVAGVLKKLHPDCKIIFLGNSYTREIVNISINIDEFADWDEIKKLDKKNIISSIKQIKADAILHVFPDRLIAEVAKKAQIPHRFGTTGRLYHWNTCNKLIRLSRRHSPFHEAQLNLKLIKSFGAKELYEKKEIPLFYGMKNIKPLTKNLKDLISKKRFNLILHPKSKRSAREWGTNNFAQLIRILPKDKFKIFITGTKEEGQLIQKPVIEKFPEVNDLTGKLTLGELISFISDTDGLVAASTGPLHVAAALGKYAIGIYPPIKPMHPGRWAPVGKNASYLVLDKKCNKCRKNSHCDCIEDINPELVKNKLMEIIL